MASNKLLILFICFSGILVFLLFIKFSTNIVDEEVQKLYDLPKTYTLDQAVNDGMINVTDICDKPNKKINDFLNKVSHRKKAILKTVESTKEDLAIKLFLYDNKTNEIRVWKYFVKIQGSESPDRRFITTFTLSDEDGISKVYLANYNETEFQELLGTDKLKDYEYEVLYSYLEVN